MAFAGTEWDQVCGWSPGCAVTVGDYMVTINNRGTVPSGATLPADTYSIFNSATNTARVFSGVSGYSKNFDGMVAYGGYAWAVYNDAGFVGTPYVERIDPVSGSLTQMVQRAGQYIAAADGKIFTWKESSTVSAWDVAAGASWGPVGGFGSGGWGSATPGSGLLVLSRTGTGITKWDVTTNPPTSLSVTTLPPGMYAIGRGAIIGDYVYFRASGGLMRYNWVTPAATFLPYTPTGYPGDASGYATVAGPDGYIYGLTGSGSVGSSTPLRMTVVNPADSTWQVDDLPTVRARRAPLILGPNGNLWMPTGEPLG